MIRLITCEQDNNVPYKADYIFDFNFMNSNNTEIIKALNHYIEDKNINILFYRAWRFDDFDTYKLLIVNHFTLEQQHFLFTNTVAYINVKIKSNKAKYYNSFKYNFLFRFSLPELKNYRTFDSTYNLIFNMPIGEMITKFTNKMYERLVINYDNFIEKEKN